MRASNLYTSMQSRQQGAILIVSLLLLLIMTVLALGASQATRMQERMAGNSHDANLALQAAEAGLRDGERFIGSQIDTPNKCNTLSFPSCQVYEQGALPSQLGFQSETWWASAATLDYQGAGNQFVNTSVAEAAPANDPRYVIEEIEEIEDSLAGSPTGRPPSRMFYRVTSHSFGATPTAQVVLQTTYAKPL